jgi:hypothetical protein
MKIYIERSEMSSVVVRKVLTLDTENLRNAFSVFYKMTDEEIMKEVESSGIPRLTEEGDEFNLNECMDDREYAVTEEENVGSGGFRTYVTDKIGTLTVDPDLVNKSPTYTLYAPGPSIDDDVDIIY